ncbi:glycoside hydrolase family 26 protein [Chelativorans sp. Marseille-P2723]|uniref:glycoside hydrolase family 26 protein n=1 Tax=Chelativorans sp. Marseille-P2723 TaxID=2709133 RepID=UPI00156E7FAB|nr:glycoside hydrolase family 26 protein [Chelativorans sp. Marseille-P2723]
MKTSSKVIALSATAVILSAALLGAAGSPSLLRTAEAETAAIVRDKRPVITDASLDFGAYDPHGDFSDDRNPKIEHLFLPWEDVDLASLAVADEYARARGRDLLITIEPWSWSVDWRVSPDELYSGIMRGHYDANIAAVCSEAARLKSPVTIRWAQEMDDSDGQFTWAYWTPRQYVSAYRHIVTECRSQLPNARFMWSPKGDEGLNEFYPGDEFVDVIGLSVFGFQDYDRGITGGDRTFAERLAPGYQRVAGYGKPVVVAELGYEGDDAYVARWANDVAAPNPDFPLLTAVVYFNDKEVYAWPDGYGKPDWRVVRGLSEEG